MSTKVVPIKPPPNDLIALADQLLESLAARTAANASALQIACQIRAELKKRGARSSNLEKRLNSKELAEALGKTRKAISGMAKSGKIPGRKIGKHWTFLPSEIHKWLEEQQTP